MSRHAPVRRVIDTIPPQYTKRDLADLHAVSTETDPAAKFAVSGNGRPDRDVDLCGMLRSRPARETGDGPIAYSLPTDARGNILGNVDPGGALPGMGDAVDFLTSRTALFAGIAAFVYFKYIRKG